MPRGAVLVGSSSQHMTSHPSPSATGKPYPGIILGTNVDDNTPFCVDPWWLMENGIINARTMMIIAAIRQGKSALIKLLVKRLMQLTVGGRTPRCVITDYRPEGESTEYSKLAAHLKCTPVRMKDMRLNILDPRLYVDDKGEVSLFGLIEMARRVAEFEQEPLNADEVLALRIVMAELSVTHTLLWDLDHIARLSSGLTKDRILEFRKSDDTKLKEETENRLAKVKDPEVKAKVLEEHSRILQLDDNTPIADIVAAGVNLRNRIEAVSKGVAEGVLGTEHSYYDMMTQPVSVRDMRGLTPGAERFLMLVGGRLDIMAIDNNRRDLIPDILVDDERHRAMRIPQYVYDLRYRQQITRSVKTFEVGASHSHDSTIVGEPGSDLFRASETIQLNTGATVYGQLPDEKKILNQVQALNGFTPYEASRLPKLGKHEFAVKWNREVPMTVFKATPIGKDFDLIDTDSAARGGTTDHTQKTRQDKEAFASANGARYIGE